MLTPDAADSAELFVGSTYFSLENAETRDMAREWMRRQFEESAARLSRPLCHFVNSAEGWPNPVQ